MFDIKIDYDLRKDLIRNAVKLMKKFSFRNSKDFSGTDLSVVNPRVVGIEPNWVVIFTWIFQEIPLCKTYVAVYSRFLGTSEIIFTHQRVIHIVNASLNSHESLLAFSCSEKKENEETNKYSSFVSEVNPQNRLFSMNINWKSYQRVQFLKGNANSTEKVSQMLFFHHMENISLYHIPLTRTINEGYTIDMQPSSIHIARNHLWAQFDSKMQRLYYVVLQPLDEDGIDASGYFNVVEFDKKGDFEYVLNFILPFSFKMELMQLDSLYNDMLLSDTVACTFVNLRVLIHDDSLYICYQHPTYNDALQDSTEGSIVSSTNSFPEGLYVNYSICCVHTGYKVQSCTFTNLASEPRVLFIVSDSFVIVYAHQCFLHMLDIGREHEPIENILISKDSPFFFHNANEINLLQHFLYGDAAVFGNDIVYKFNLNLTIIYDMFCYSNVSTRLSIMHIVVIHLNNSKLIKKIVKRIFHDCCNIESYVLLKEYLVAENYASVKKLMKSKFDLKLFPFTTQEFYRGQIERNKVGERHSHLYYKRFSSDLIAHIKKNLYKNFNTLWASVYQCLCHESENLVSKRFPLKLWFLAGTSLDLKTTFSVGDIEASATSSSIYHFQNDSKKNLMKNSIAAENLCTHIISSHKNISKSAAHKLCDAYIAERNILKEVIRKLILKSLDISQEELLAVPLTQESSCNEVTLFHLLERLKTIMDELCFPSFHQMDALFQTLGFRCLQPFQFISYAKACVFDLQLPFIERVIHELENTKENVQYKFSLLDCIKEEDREVIYEKWNYTKANKIILQKSFSRFPGNIVLQHRDLIDSRSSNEFDPVSMLLEFTKAQFNSNNFELEEEVIESLHGVALS